MLGTGGIYVTRGTKCGVWESSRGLVMLGGFISEIIGGFSVTSENLKVAMKVSGAKECLVGGRELEIPKASVIA